MQSRSRKREGVYADQEPEPKRHGEDYTRRINSSDPRVAAAALEELSRLAKAVAEARGTSTTDLYSNEQISNVGKLKRAAISVQDILRLRRAPISQGRTMPDSGEMPAELNFLDKACMKFLDDASQVSSQVVFASKELLEDALAMAIMAVPSTARQDPSFLPVHERLIQAVLSAPASHLTTAVLGYLDAALQKALPQASTNRDGAPSSRDEAATRAEFVRRALLRMLSRLPSKGQSPESLSSNAMVRLGKLLELFVRYGKLLEAPVPSSSLPLLHWSKAHDEEACSRLSQPREALGLKKAETGFGWEGPTRKVLTLVEKLEIVVPGELSQLADLRKMDAADVEQGQDAQQANLDRMQELSRPMTLELDTAVEWAGKFPAAARVHVKQTVPEAERGEYQVPINLVVDSVVGLNIMQQSFCTSRLTIPAAFSIKLEALGKLHSLLMEKVPLLEWALQQNDSKLLGALAAELCAECSSLSNCISSADLYMERITAAVWLLRVIQLQMSSGTQEKLNDLADVAGLQSESGVDPLSVAEKRPQRWARVLGSSSQDQAADRVVQVQGGMAVNVLVDELMRREDQLDDAEEVVVGLLMPHLVLQNDMERYEALFQAAVKDALWEVGADTKQLDALESVLLSEELYMAVEVLGRLDFALNSKNTNHWSKDSVQLDLGCEMGISRASKNIMKLLAMPGLGTSIPQLPASRKCLTDNIRCSTFPSDHSAGTGIREVGGLLAGGMRTMHTAVLPAVRDLLTGEAFAFVARPAVSAKRTAAMSVARVKALRSHDARESFGSGLALLSFLDALAAAALREVVRYCVATCLGEEEWTRMEQQPIKLLVFSFELHGTDASGQHVVAIRDMMLELQPPTPAALHLLHNTGVSGQGKAAAKPLNPKQRKVASPPGRVVWGTVRGPQGGVVPPLPLFSAADPVAPGGKASTGKAVWACVKLAEPRGQPAAVAAVG